MTDKKTLKGVLHLHSETGTEGGYWAFQNERFIKHVPASHAGVWGGQTVWDQARPDRQGTTQADAEVLRDGQWFPLPDPMQGDPDYSISSLFRGEGRGDHEADKRLMEKYDFTMLYPSERMQQDMDMRFGKGNWQFEGDTAHGPDGKHYHYGGTPQAERPYGVAPGQLTRVTVEWTGGVEEQRLSDSLLVTRWSYEGLKILRNGDQLAIYDKADPSLIVWQGVIKLKQHPLFTEDASGMWIHADMVGWDRDEWAKFFFEGYPAALTPK